MSKKDYEEVFNCDQVADFIKETPANILEMVEQCSIPHSLLPTGKPVFLKGRIYDWLISRDPTALSNDESTEQDTTEGGIPQFAQMILDRLGYSHKTRLKWGYINLYKRPQKTFAQLHFPSSVGGVDLALWEGSADSDLPNCSVLKKIDHLSILKGHKQGNNKDWLEGRRLSKSAAAAFNIPSALQTDPNHPGWEELQILVRHVYEKR